MQINDILKIMPPSARNTQGLHTSTFTGGQHMVSTNYRIYNAFFDQIAKEIEQKLEAQPNGTKKYLPSPDWQILFKFCPRCEKSLTAIRENNIAYCLVCAQPTSGDTE